MTRFVLGGMLILALVVFGSSPLLSEQVAAACTPSVLVTLSNQTKVGAETVSATVTVTANASTGSGPDTLKGVTFTGARNGEVRVQGQLVSMPRTFTLASVPSWSFEIRKPQAGASSTIFFTATDSCGDVTKFVGFGTGTGGGAQPATATPTPTVTPTSTRTPTPTSTATSTVPKIRFGLGAEADRARVAPFTQAAPVKMLTSWYNGPGDLSWMTEWGDDLVPQSYAAGYTLHLVVYSGDAEGALATPYGPACGRAYPLSSRFVGDMVQLAQTFNGSGPLYVTLFTEFQTYPCGDNAWVGSENYYRALKDQYTAARAAFRQHAPNANVSIGWGGWQASWDDPAKGGGRSLFPHFADVMDASEFQSFQAMESDTNVADVRAMVQTLGAYGPVMLAHYKPDNGSCATATADLQVMLTASFLAEVTANGLFAWGFMDEEIVTCSPQLNTFLKNAVTTYGQ